VYRREERERPLLSESLHGLAELTIQNQTVRTKRNKSMNRFMFRSVFSNNRYSINGTLLRQRVL
jgi:hypothetical protein